MGESWLEILEDPLTRKLLGHDATMVEKVPFVSGVHSRFKYLLQDPLKHLSFAKIGYTALEAFLQANCTGPPLDFDSVPVIIPEAYHDEIPRLREEMLKSLSVDGIDVYPSTSRIELFWLAKCMMDSGTLAEEGFNGRRARFRINFWHQKLLPEHSDTLHNMLYHDADVLDTQISSRLVYGGAAAQEHMIEYLVERANVRIFYGDELDARDDLLRAAKLRDFEFALTGVLGKKTKHQEKDFSQLVVMAKSRDHEPEPYSSRKSSRADASSRKSSIAERSIRSLSLRPMTPGSPNSDMAQMFSSMAGALTPRLSLAQPTNIPLNDDNLFDNIQFSARPHELGDPATEVVTEQSHLPIGLAFMDPAEQPQLFPMDSIILLAVASTITNTHAADGLTREQTLPYAVRVIESGSSNWSVYSQALLLRSRIDGYQSRTAERGLLQLQALVDQITAETTGQEVEAQAHPLENASNRSGSTTFIPRVTTEEGGTVGERLRFIHQLQPPFIWELEIELATRWTQMGGLKTALEIYKRLQMDPEIILCLAATDREAEAVSLLKKILFVNPDQDMQDGDLASLNTPIPPEAARLLCILGDIKDEPKYYNLAWTVSNNRYARAQRSLGKYYIKGRDLEAAAQAYVTALRVSRLDVATWFSLGCLYLELQDWQGAVEAFTRVVQLEDKDAQGWSNLAVSLLKLPAPISSPTIEKKEPGGLETIEEAAADDDDTETIEAEPDPLQHTREALRALRRAAHLKRDDPRIWDNYLTVAASIPPDPQNPDRSTPWQEVIHAMNQVIAMRQQKEGESCIDIPILDALVEHVSSTWDYPTSEEAAESSADPQLMRTASQDSSLIADSDDNQPPGTPPAKSPSPDREPPVPKIPFLVRSLTTLIDSHVAPLATASPPLFLILSRVALWRHRPTESLALIEKSWRATLNKHNPTATPRELADATETLVNAYQTLGPMERERTGGLVEKAWQFKAKSAVRSALGRSKGAWEEREEAKELAALMEGLSTRTETEMGAAS